MLQRNFDQPYPAAPEPVPTAVAGWQAPTVDLREMARILRRRWRAVVLPAAVLGGIALAYVATATTLYTANSTVLVDPRRANVVETNQSVLTNFGTDDATIESQTLLIQSLTILQRVVDKLKLTQDLEFMPKPGLLDPIRNLFRSSSPVDGVSPGRRRACILYISAPAPHEGDTTRHDIPGRYRRQLGIAAESRDHRQCGG